MPLRAAAGAPLIYIVQTLERAAWLLRCTGAGSMPVVDAVVLRCLKAITQVTLHPGRSLTCAIPCVAASPLSKGCLVHLNVHAGSRCQWDTRAWVYMRGHAVHRLSAQHLPWACRCSFLPLIVGDAARSLGVLAHVQQRVLCAVCCGRPRPRAWLGRRRCCAVAQHGRHVRLA